MNEGNEMEGENPKGESPEPASNPVEVEEGESSKAAFNEAEDAELANAATAEEYLDKHGDILLDYERQMFLDLIHHDGLLITARGISYDRVLVNILKVYADPGNLILVLNSSDWEENYYKSQLDPKYVHEVAANANERERVYLEGGIQFISTRILVVDLLKKRIPIELITGLIVLRAHTIVESCQEAFAVRLFRQINKTGFIKAFSSSAEAFTIGYSHVERTMRNVFVKELFIWPRFHAIVKGSLKPYESQTVELHVPMTTNMTKIQTQILDIMNYLVKELKRINRSLDLSEITVENCVTKKFHKILQAQLDCIWHQLNSQTKLIVSDLKVLRNLMISTIYGDAVSAYALVKRYRTTEYAHNNSGWILLDAAENLFKAAKDRVFNSEQQFCPELCPKWRVLSEILRVEIPNDVKRSKEKSNDTVKVLILCQDSRTCHQLNQYLTEGGERFLLFMAMRNEIPVNKLADSYKNIQNHRKLGVQRKEITSKNASQKLKSTPKEVNLETNEKIDEESQILMGKDDKVQKEEDELTEFLTQNDPEDMDVYQESYVLTLSQRAGFDTSVEIENDEHLDATLMESADFEPFPELENLDITSIMSTNKQPIVCIQTFKTEREGSTALERTLNEVDPQYIIMYHSNVTAIRQLEIFEARKKRPLHKRLRVFFLMHAGTVEEQSYLTSLRREKQAFELLIEAKKSMVVPEYQDGRTDEAFILLKAHEDDEVGPEINTREAGGQKPQNLEVPKIIVDMREFRSDLPCLIHRRGMEVIPVTITIGDYILTPEICVERKSISDLIGSLNSGRLYNQCIQMQRYYSKPILLIEFDQNKPFHLQGKYMISGESITSNADIVQKLQLLTLHFPKLRLIWSPSPYATAQLFEELKQGKSQPDSAKAALIGSDESNPTEIDKFNTNIFDFMIRLPGINSKNIGKVMRHGGSLKELLKKSEADLAELLDSQANAKLLWNILHVAHSPAPTEPNDKPFTSKFRRGRGRGRRF
ncbi:unnamed protein product [Hermetia illucens]|uniref:DNA repair endonuclease XPF n=1 Tax=Hermetia illucens TaxID=343691 RepID=A0A7R8UVE0_HERIL|nr:DNA repair endonuclease XPF [Hermetia illucens]CAD7087672.1 unnamed protein product [Hermetia illucens]